MTNILFPIETIVRELDYRLFLAAKVLKPGRRVFICNHRHLDKIMKHFRGGVYVGKHIYPSLSAVKNRKSERYKKAKSLGIDIVYIHEEGAIYAGTPDDWEKIILSRFDPTGFDCNDRLCVWGKWQKSVHEKQKIEVPVHATGHPRFDLYKEKYREFYKNSVDELRKKHGNFILVNGNYGFSNFGLGVGHIFSPRFGYNPTDSEKRHRFVGFYAHTTKSMVDMISLVHQLSTAFPEKNLIYRSHPSEGDNLYNHVFSGLHNVKVIHEGAVGPWLLAAETIIHDGCTTAIEASFSNTQIINYKTNEDETHDIRLPNLVGTKATNPKEVIELISQREKQQICGDKLNELTAMIANYQDDSFACLSNVIEDVTNSLNQKLSKTPSRFTLQCAYAKYVLKRRVRQSISRKRRRSKQYQDKKFRGFDLSTIQEQVSNAGKIMDVKMNIVYVNPLMLVLEGGK